MNISISELLACMYADDREVLTGFDMTQYGDVPFDENEVNGNLVEEELFEKEGEDGKYGLSSFGAFCMNVISNPDVWLVIKNSQQELTRRIFIRDEYYLYLDEVEDRIIGDVLPSLPIVFGGCAKMLEISDSEEEGIIVEGFGKSGDTDILFDIYSDNTYVLTIADETKQSKYNETDLLNTIIQWIISGLKDIEETEEEINE